jgi:Type IV secretion system pilin
MELIQIYQNSFLQKLQNSFNIMIKFLLKNLNQLKILASMCFLFLMFFGTITAFAATETDGGGLAGLQPSGIRCIFYDKNTKIKECTEQTALTTIVQKFLIDIAPAVTTLLIIFGGYEYFVDKEAKKTSALSTIIAAISGFIIITLAPIITNVIKATFSDEKKPFNTEAIKGLLVQITDLLLNLSSVVAVAVIVLGGYAYFIQFFVNGGKQEGKLNARDLLFGGIAGLIIATLARPIVKFIQSTIGSTANGDLITNQDNIINFIKNILANFLIPFSSIAALVFIIIAAYLWLTAGSDEDKVKNAKKFLNNALIGLVVVLLSTVIVQLIIYFVQPGISFIPGSLNTNTVIQGGNTPVTNTTK